MIKADLLRIVGQLHVLLFLWDFKILSGVFANRLRKMEDNDIDGTTLYGQYTGIIMYADDIILMSTTLNGLRNLVENVTQISKENSINFNADKTEFCISKQKGVCHSFCLFVITNTQN